MNNPFKRKHKYWVVVKFNEKSNKDGICGFAITVDGKLKIKQIDELAEAAKEHLKGKGINAELVAILNIIKF